MTRALLSTLAWLLPAVLLLVVSQTLSPPAQAQSADAGSLDVSFGGDGKVTTAVGPYTSRATAMTVLDDDKILAAGYSRSGIATDFALARYNAAGTLDNTFGDGDGTVTTDFALEHDLATAMAVQSDGKILVGGHTWDGDYNELALARYNADGSLDTTFGGGDGLVVTSTSSGNENIDAIAVQSDGKIVVAGRTNNGSNDDFLVARYNADGSLDTGFGDDAGGNNVKKGWVKTDFGVANDVLLAILLQSGGKIVVGGSARVGGNDNFALARYTSAGVLDTTFGGGDGHVTTDFSSGDDRIHGLVAQSDGKLVAAGYSSANDFALARYTADGVLDTTFGTNGKVTTDLGSTQDRPTSMVQQSDGKLVVAGYTRPGGNREFALARYTAAGVLDTAFGNQGKVIHAIGDGDDRIGGLGLQSSGKIVAAGRSDNGSHDDFAIARYTTAGALDTSFGRDADNDGARDGYFTTSVGHRADIGEAVALQSDGKILVAGRSHNTVNWDFGLARYNADASLDIGFGIDGRVNTDFASGNDQGFGVAVQSDGKIVAAGYANTGSNDDFALARYNADGVLDTTFDSDGKVTTDFSSGEDRGFAMSLQSGGKIVVAGYANNGSNDDFAMARYNANGSLDSTFGTGGKVTTAIGSGNDRIRAIALQSDGKIVAAGYANNGTDWDFALARYNADGSLDTGFGGDADGNNTPDGWLTTAIGSGDDIGRAVAVQDDGKIVVAGGAVIRGESDFALARYTSAGVLDTTFGAAGTGHVTTSISSESDQAYGVLLQDGGRTVVAGYSGSPTDGGGEPRDFSMVRYHADGSLDADFGTEGKVTTSIVPGDDRAYAAMLQPDGKIVLAGFAHRAEGYELALARYHAPVPQVEVRTGPPTVSLSASPNPVREGTSITITATLSRALSSDVTIPVTLLLGSAIDDGDVGTLSSITIRAGETTGTGNLATVADGDSEFEVFTVALGELPPSVEIGIPNSVRITITEGLPTRAPARPSISGVEPGNGTLTVTWIVPVGDPNGYDIQYKEESSSTWSDVPAPGRNSANQPLTTTTITGLVNGATYDLRVRARNLQGTGGWSPVSQGTPVAPLGAVTNLAVNSDFERVTATWDAPAGQIDFYEVQHKESAVTEWEEGFASPTRSTSRSILNLEAGTSYDVQVRAVNATSAGPWTMATGATYQADAPSSLGLIVLPPPAEGLRTAARPDAPAGESLLYISLDRAALSGGTNVVLSTGGTAEKGIDYTLNANVSIAQGETTVTVKLQVIDDDVDDDGETIIISARAAGTDRQPEMSYSVTVTIGDNEPVGGL